MPISFQLPESSRRGNYQDRKGQWAGGVGDGVALKESRTHQGRQRCWGSIDECESDSPMLCSIARVTTVGPQRRMTVGDMDQDSHDS
jgi:hypothetical protein